MNWPLGPRSRIYGETLKTTNCVAIHQPDFYPWLGFFDKWARADVLVLLDDAQFPKSAPGGWTNRCSILHAGEWTWFTAPVQRNFHGVRTIREVDLVERGDWRRKLMQKFNHAYARAPMVSEARELLAADLLGDQPTLMELNVSALRRLAVALELDESKLILSSTLNVTEKSTQRLASIVQKVNGDIYLCGGGASGYQDDQVFAESGIRLVYQNFKHPRYEQTTTRDFVPGLSILDALSFVGVDGSKSLVSRARHK